MGTGRTQGQKLSVFKGREAKLNRAILLILAQEVNLTIYDICKKIRTQKPLRYTKYSVINRRVKKLENEGYIIKVGPRRTLAGFKAQLYELTIKAYLSMLLNQTDLNKFIDKAEEETIVNALATFILTWKKEAPPSHYI